MTTVYGEHAHHQFGKFIAEKIAQRRDDINNADRWRSATAAAAAAGNGDKSIEQDEST